MCYDDGYTLVAHSACSDAPVHSRRVAILPEAVQHQAFGQNHAAALIVEKPVEPRRAVTETSAQNMAT